MSSKPMIIFVCEHGAAKSIIAAAYFNRFAADANLTECAIARGTNPDPQLSSRTIEGLSQDGLIPTEAGPQKLTQFDLGKTDWIVSFCDLPAEYQENKIVKFWDDIPTVSESYESARDAIVDQLRLLIEDIRRSK